MSERLLDNEKTLLIEVSEGNESSFRQLFEAYRAKLFTYIFKISESREISEDIVHDIFLKIWLQRDKLALIQNLNAYLYRMAHNHAYNGLRRMATETLVMAELGMKVSYETGDPEYKLVRKEMKQLINEVIDHLTPQQKAVFGMSWEEGLKQEEIASRLNISILTVKKHLTDARNNLRKEISLSYPVHAIAIFVIYGFLP